jgi:SAM-dependent methyltransferase
MGERGERPWYEEAFRAEYLDVYPHRDLAAARREVAGLVERGLCGRVLDLGCGWGRHAIALAERGVDVIGLDRSAELLAHGLEVEGGARLSGRLVRGDMRHLPFAGRAFDAVALLFSSFGYFDDAGNARVLDEIARVLRPGGLALFDLMNSELVRARLVPESVREDEDTLVVERRWLAEDGRRVVKVVHVTAPGGRESTWTEDVRLYETQELRGLLAERGLTLERVEGDFDGRPSGADAPRQIVWARG